MRILIEQEDEPVAGAVNGAILLLALYGLAALIWWLA
jgi:hypothetical protein